MDKLHELFFFFVIQHGIITYITGALLTFVIAGFIIDLDDGDEVGFAAVATIFWPLTVVAGVVISSFLCLLHVIKQLKKKTKTFVQKGRL